MIRNLTFEWRRAATIRSTWGFPLLGVAVLLVASMGGYWLANDGTLTLVWMLGQTAFPLGLVLVTVICAQAFGHDYRDGTMRLVLSEFPARGRVFWAKMAVPAVLVLSSILIVQLAVLLANLVYMHLPVGGWDEVATAAARGLVFAVWWGLMVGAITALMRNLAAGIVVALVLATIGEALLIGLVGPKWSGISYLTPFSNAMAWASSGNGKAGAIAGFWSFLVVGSALWAFLKRDA